MSHLSPEGLVSGHLSKASDVYAYGITLWELYTGGSAYQGERCWPLVLLNQSRLDALGARRSGVESLASACRMSVENVRFLGQAHPFVS